MRGFDQLGKGEWLRVIKCFKEVKERKEDGVRNAYERQEKKPNYRPNQKKKKRGKKGGLAFEQRCWGDQRYFFAARVKKNHKKSQRLQTVTNAYKNEIVILFGFL